VGDSDKDIGAGKAVGVGTIFLKNDYNSEELARVKPDSVVSSLAEVIQFL
jgi:phosphoglycolate phosphatase-like HAD superfamily hydrolase